MCSRREARESERPPSLAHRAARLTRAAASPQSSSAATREAGERFEETYGFPPERLLKGRAWSSDWWDLEEGDGLLEFVLKVKLSPFWTDEQKDRLVTLCPL